jgi:NAD-dependent deacetylase
VPNILKATKVVQNAEILVIIGTSLQVYPAASLADYVSEECQKFLIDPKDISSISNFKFEHIKRNATDGMKILYERLIT